MSQLRQVVDALRDRILTGTFAPGTRLMEVPLAAMLGTSRTPIRLALGALERENLVETAGPRRGFVVASFALEDVFGAIEARGVLEGLAARTCAERGLSADAERRLTDCVERGRALLAAGLDAPEAGDAWTRNNVAFHATLVAEARNRALAGAIEGLGRIPLVAPSAVILRTRDRAGDERRLQRAQDDHADILHAITARQGLRAEMLLREHALLNIRNKQANFAEIKARKATGDLPGLDLVGGMPTGG